MRIRWDPKGERFPAFHGRYILYADRGQLRVRSWPRKRGPSKSSEVRIQNQWFTDANKLAKHCAASQQVQAIALTKGTGLYPRDLLLKCMVGGIIAPITADGRELQVMRKVVEPVTFQGFNLRLNANQNIGIGVMAAPTWPLPHRDTLGFWSVASPTLITIPLGVTMMQFYSGALAAAQWNNWMIGQIRDPAGDSWGRSDNVGNTSHGIQVGTGPIVVTPGQQFEAVWQLGAGGVLQGTTENTWFAGVVMEAG